MPPRATTPRPARPRRIPSKNKVTPEAQAELAKSGITVSDSAGNDQPVYDPENPVAQDWFTDQTNGNEAEILAGQAGPVLPQSPVVDPGAVIDSAAEPPDKPLIDPEKPIRTDLKTTPPSSDEWLDFFSRIVLKIGMELYTDFAFRGIDESVLSDRDIQRIRVGKDERDSIARPFAEYATKNKFIRKHGREVVALTDSAESLMTLGIWMRRVNRVAKKYRPKKAQKPQNLRIREPENVGNGSSPGNGSVKGTTNGHVPDGFAVYNPGGG